jgi:hypothetical protein
MIDALRAFFAGKARGRPKLFPLTNSLQALQISRAFAREIS